jgi:hypothetical protein
MLRRMLLLGVVIYAAVLLTKANTKLAADKQKDRHAVANWDSEGGTPAPDPVDTPTTA